MDSSSVQPAGLATASNPGPTNAPSNLSLTSVMADQYIGLRHFSTCEEARADRDSRVVCAPETDDLDAVKSSESFWLNRILGSFVQVLSHDPEKPECIKQSESDWREDVQTFKNEIYSKIIKSGLISHQAEKTGRLLLVCFLCKTDLEHKLTCRIARSLLASRIWMARRSLEAR